MTALSALLVPWAAFAVALTSLSPAVPPPAGAHPHHFAAAPSATPALSSHAQPVRAPATTPARQPAGRWSWPLTPQPPVVRPFARPSSDYGQGHRGVDLGGRAGQDVSAVDAGTVSHVGVIAGRGTVTVLHPSGLRSTYEPVSAEVTVGKVVARGDRLGALAETGSHCAPRACLHLGAVRDRTYLDPVALLGARRVRLLPLQPVP